MSTSTHLLTIDEVANRLRVSRSWLSRARKDGAFAPEIKLGPGRVVFSETAIAEWLATRVERRDAA